MKRLFKYIGIVLVYLFVLLVLEWFIGGGIGKKDIWDDLSAWAKK